MKTRKPWINLLLAVIASFVCLFTYKVIGRAIFSQFTNDYIGYFMAQLFFAVIVTIAVFVLRRTDVYRPESACMKSAWTSAGFTYLVILFYFVLGLPNLITASVSWWEILLVIAQTLLVGYCEEILFRGLVQKAMHNLIGEKTRGQVVLGILLSALIFGSAHLANATSVSLAASAIQAVVTLFVSVYWGAIFYRSGKNIWFLIPLHGIYDLVGSIAGGRLNGAPLETASESTVQYGWYIILLWGVLYSLAAAIILRPKKLDPLLKH